MCSFRTSCCCTLGRWGGSVCPSTWRCGVRSCTPAPHSRSCALSRTGATPPPYAGPRPSCSRCAAGVWIALQPCPWGTGHSDLHSQSLPYTFFALRKTVWVQGRNCKRWKNWRLTRGLQGICVRIAAAGCTSRAALLELQPLHFWPLFAIALPNLPHYDHSCLHKAEPSRGQWLVQCCHWQGVESQSVSGTLVQRYKWGRKRAQRTIRMHKYRLHNPWLLRVPKARRN